jgi:hypothetical protein
VIGSSGAQDSGWLPVLEAPTDDRCKLAGASDETAQMAKDKIVTLRVELEGISPLVWRRFAVPAAIRLDSLHRVIQAVMNWQERHLWMITADDHRCGIIIPSDDDWNERITNAATVQLASVLSGGLEEFG